MRHTLLLLVTFMCCAFAANENSNTVYICTGPQSKRYHKTADCRGLRSCSKEIRKVTLEYAKKIGRTPCGYCY